MLGAVDVVLGGFAEDDPTNPLWMIPPSVVDQRVLPGPVAKERREDLQLWGALQSLALLGMLTHPVATRAGDDPPDRRLTAGGSDYAVELTELTLQQLRGRLAWVYWVGRLVSELLSHGADRYRHLAGRGVLISDATVDDAVNSLHNPREVAEQIAAALTEDRGFVGEGVDLSAGFPSAWPNRRGFYEKVAGFFVQVNQDTARPPGRPVPVVASSQATLSLRDVRTLFWSRVAAKDQPCNQVLIVSTGLVDAAGYVCAVDQWIFQMLAEHGVGEPPAAPENLDAVVLHNYGSGNLFIAYQREDAGLPWQPS